MIGSTSKTLISSCSSLRCYSNPTSKQLPTMIISSSISNGSRRGYASASTSSNKQSQSTSASTSSTPPTLSLSSCQPGTILTGLSILKDRPDPISLPDNQYPTWLWSIASDSSSSTSSSDDDDGSSSGNTTQTKGEMRMALKRAAKIKRQEETKSEKNRKRLGNSNSKKSLSSGGGEKKDGKEKIDGNNKEEVLSLDLRTKDEIVEDEKRKVLRKSNKSSIKASNFLKSS